MLILYHFVKKIAFICFLAKMTVMWLLKRRELGILITMFSQMPLAYAEFDRFGAPTPAGIPASARLESVEVAGVRDD